MSFVLIPMSFVFLYRFGAFSTYHRKGFVLFAGAMAMASVIALKATGWVSEDMLGACALLSFNSCISLFARLRTNITTILFCCTNSPSRQQDEL
jgi:hypothetical protein